MTLLGALLLSGVPGATAATSTGTAAGADAAETPPSDLRVVEVTPFTVALTWEPSSIGGQGEDQLYFVEDESGKMWAWFRRDATSGTVSGLVPNTTYTFRLGAWNGTPASSPRSEPVTFTTGDAEPLPVPSNLRVTENETGTDVTIDFDVAADPRIDGFQVTQGGREFFNYGLLREDTKIFAHGLTPETDYAFAISVVMETGNGREWVGEPSEALSVTTSRDGQAPRTPGGPNFVDRTGTSVTLSWGIDEVLHEPADNVGVVGFLVSNGETTKVVPSENSFGGDAGRAVFTGLEPETSYTFTVQSRDAAGNVSAPTAPRTISTGVEPDTEPPTPVTNLRASRENGWSSVLWNGSTDNVTLQGAIRYHITTDGGDDITQTGTILVRGPSNPPVLSGCEVTVEAIDTAGNVSEPRSTSLC